MLRARFNQLEERGLTWREWVETPRDSIDIQQALNTARAPLFIRLVLRPIELWYIDVRQGLRQWAMPLPHQDERSGRGMRMQYPRQLGMLQFSQQEADGKGPTTLLTG